MPDAAVQSHGVAPTIRLAPAFDFRCELFVQNVSQEFARIGFERTGQVGEFDDLQSPLTLLQFRNEGLRPSKRLREFCLRHTAAPPRFGNSTDQTLMARRAKGLCHGACAALVDETSSLIPLWDYPILGYYAGQSVDLRSRMPVSTPIDAAEFKSWYVEWQALEEELDRTPEKDDRDGKRDRLFRRIFEIEHLILTTPSADISAIRVKAATLVWLMEMDGSDGLPAMRHIRDYLERQA